MHVCLGIHIKNGSQNTFICIYANMYDTFHTHKTRRNCLIEEQNPVV